MLRATAVVAALLVAVTCTSQAQHLPHVPGLEELPPPTREEFAKQPRNLGLDAGMMRAHLRDSLVSVLDKTGLNEDGYRGVSLASATTKFFTSSDYKGQSHHPRPRDKEEDDLTFADLHELKADSVGDSAQGKQADLGPLAKDMPTNAAADQTWSSEEAPYFTLPAPSQHSVPSTPQAPRPQTKPPGPRTAAQGTKEGKDGAERETGGSETSFVSTATHVHAHTPHQRRPRHTHQHHAASATTTTKAATTTHHHHHMRGVGTRPLPDMGTLPRQLSMREIANVPLGSLDVPLDGAQIPGPAMSGPQVLDTDSVLKAAEEDDGFELPERVRQKALGLSGRDMLRAAETGDVMRSKQEATQQQAKSSLQSAMSPNHDNKLQVGQGSRPGGMANQMIAKMMGAMAAVVGAQGSLQAMDGFFKRVEKLGPQPLKKVELSPLAESDGELLQKFKRMASFANDPLGGTAGDGYFDFGDGSSNDCYAYLDQYLSQCNHMEPQLVGMLEVATTTAPILSAGGLLGPVPNQPRTQAAPDSHLILEHAQTGVQQPATRPAAPFIDGSIVKTILDVVAYIVNMMTEGKGSKAKAAFKRFRMQMQKESVRPHKIRLGSVNDKTDWWVQQALLGEAGGATQKLPDSYDPFGPAGPEPMSMPNNENNKWCHDMMGSWLRRCVLPEQL